MRNNRKIIAAVLGILLISASVLTGCVDAGAGPVILLEGSVVETVELFAGEELQLTFDGCEKPKWSSSDTNVVEVEQDGYLSARAEGTATVTLAAGRKTVSVEVTVNPYIPVEEIMSKNETLIVKAGAAKAIRMEVLPENASDPSLIYHAEPADGILTFENGQVIVSEDAVPGTVYQVTATNPRSAVTCTFMIEISELKGLTAWTIGDSIFDFRDNSETDMVQSLLTQSGYTNFYMDNIAGSTVRAASGVGIIDHIGSGMYDAWPEPDLIIVYRGTNDVYFSIQQPNFFTEHSIIEAVQKTCQYLHENYPDARIVWATPLWRNDVGADRLNWMRQLLHDTCPQYGIEVFDLHLAENFADLSSENFGPVLYDGIHLTDLGAQYLRDAYIAYLTNDVS